MSIYSQLSHSVPFSDLFDGRLAQFGVTERLGPETTSTLRCLTDGENWIQFYENKEGIAELENFGSDVEAPGPKRVVQVLFDVFGIRIVFETQPEYWGFETQEEWDNYLAKRAEEDEANFYAECMKYVRGEENDIKPGTVGEGWAMHAKVLIVKNPQLAMRENKVELLREARTLATAEKERKHEELRSRRRARQNERRAETS